MKVEFNFKSKWKFSFRRMIKNIFKITIIAACLHAAFPLPSFLETTISTTHSDQHRYPVPALSFCYALEA